ncbi:hypothetical protein M3Y97_01089600 [Aphelenchoides bicaudatus]|nr:hypothetical protein M3Y97_01089600 [Aphelenchoides bicaudatus]
MVDQVLINLIHQEILDGRSDSEIFDKVMREADKNKKLFDGIAERNEKFGQATSSKRVQLNQLIQDEIKKAERSLNAQKCLGKDGYQNWCSLCLVSSRYSLDFQHYSLFLFDNYWRQKRALQIEGARLPYIKYASIAVVDQEHFFIFDGSFALWTQNSAEFVGVQFWKLDVENLKCTRLYSAIKNFKYPCVVNDLLDPRTFALVVQIGDTYHLCKGNVNTWHLGLNERYLPINVKIKTGSLKLVGNKMYGLECDPENKTKFFFNELIIDDEQIQSARLFTVEIDVGFYGISYFNWHADKAYFFHFHDKDSCPFYELNVTRQQITQTPFKIFNQIQSAKIRDDLLIVCTKTDKTQQHVLQRLPLSKPDKLENMALEVLRKRAFFTDNTTFDLIVEKLPATLRPFGQF